MQASAQPSNGAIQKVPDQSTLAGYLQVRRAHLEEALPKSKGLTVERLIKLAVLATTKQPALKNCQMASVFTALMQCAELGLEPSGTLGHAYLVPFKDQCQLVIGYRGLIDLARRSGALKQIEAHVVHTSDRFKLRFGLEPMLEHEPALDGEVGAPRLVYCVAQLADGAKHVEVMTIAEVNKIRARSRAKGGPWETDFEEMAKKTVARRACKWIPMSSELAKALDLEGESEGYHAPETGEVLGVTVPGESKTAKTKEAVRAKLAAKHPAVIDVKPGETEEQAEARVTSDGEPPDDVPLPTDADFAGVAQ